MPGSDKELTKSTINAPNFSTTPASDVPYTTPESGARLAPVFEDLSDYAKGFQAGFGMEPIEFTADSVHLISPENAALMPDLSSGSTDEKEGGVYDTKTGIIYLIQPEQTATTFELIDYYYGLAHETGHKLTPGLNGLQSPEDNSFLLREGIVDRFARDFMYRVCLPKYFPEVAAEINRKFADNSFPFSREDLALRADEVIFMDPNGIEAAGAFSRTIETRAVEHLEALMGQSAFAELMRAASSKDTSGPRRVVTSHLGREVWGLLTVNSGLSPSEVLRRLLK
jgi:hypothetical protein